MIARLQKSMAERDKGFTLVELLVVIVIIGILAGIAIPLFLSQRKKGVDAALKSDIKNVATAMETAYVDERTYPEALTDFDDAVEVSDAATQLDVYTVNGANDTFCIIGSNENGTGTFYYASNGGGLKSTAEGACDGVTTPTFNVQTAS